MDDAGAVGLIEGVAELLEEVADERGGHGAVSLGVGLEVLPLEQLHREEGHAPRLVEPSVEDVDDVGVRPDPRADLGLSDEELDELRARDQVRVNELERADAARPGVAGLVDDGHPALAEDGLDPVPAPDHIPRGDAHARVHRRPPRMGRG